MVTYTVTEVLNGAQGAASATYSLDSNSSVTSGYATTASGANAEVVLSNVYTAATQPSNDVGTLIIRKSISGAALADLEQITFTVVGSNNTTLSIPALTTSSIGSVVGSNWIDEGNGVYTFTVSNLPADVTYTVTETLNGTQGSASTRYTLDQSSVTIGTAKIVANGDVTVILSDVYAEITNTTTPTPSPSETTPSETTPSSGTPDGSTPTPAPGTTETTTGETTQTPETSETTEPVEVASVTLDGQPLDSDSYTVNPDGSITLNEALRRTLGSGNHTIVITYVNGATLTQTVTIDGADRSIGSTGETSVNVAAAVILLAAIACVYFSRKLREDAER